MMLFAEIYIGMNQFPEAVAKLQTVMNMPELSRDVKHWAIRTMAQCLIGVKKYNKALQAMNAIPINERRIIAHIVVQQAQMGLGDLSGALITCNGYIRACRMMHKSHVIASMMSVPNSGFPASPSFIHATKARAIALQLSLGHFFWALHMYTDVELTVQEEKVRKLCKMTNQWFQTCSACGNDRQELFHCGLCKISRYCDGKCQASDWEEHKKICSRM